MVEDNRADVVLLKEALSACELTYRISVAQDGVEALDFLCRRAEFAQAPKPELIILDLNLPRKGGREVIAEIMPDQELRKIPLIILTSSRADQDIPATFGLPQDCYMIKPSNFRGYIELAGQIEAFRKRSSMG